MNENSVPYPPYYYTMQVLDFEPSAASTFFMLWRDFYDLPDNQIRLTYDKQIIEHDRYLRWNRFLKDVNILGRIGLLERFVLDADRITVELAEWYDEN